MGGTDIFFAKTIKQNANSRHIHGMETLQSLKLNPLNDFLFYKIMGERGDKGQLLAFLNAVLKRADPERLVSVTIMENRTLTADVIGGKTGILDVRAELQDGTVVNIELQIKNEGNMDKRSLFYCSRLYAKGIVEGQDYIELPKVIAINIVNYSFPKSPQYHTCFHLYEDREKDLLLTDA